MMDFDMSKENIQPLRGGRNLAQLEVAIQAQSSAAIQIELSHQKQEYDNAIRTYQGEDPLENWYHYISWVEQSFPKNGHEGNLVNLLQECLSKFEDDRRYNNDRRFCKLWIKFIDCHQNPLELYHMLHAKGICKGCADLYKAWAFYHEMSGDYKSADMVFMLGRQELAQPYDDLIAAHQNMVYAAGQQVISGLNHDRLMEQRQALTMLKTYKPGKVGSIRTAASSTPGILPSSTSRSRSNAPVAIYEDSSEQMLGAAAAPVSVIDIARRDQAPKENIMKPGIWTTCSSNRGPMAHRQPAFTIHVDDFDIYSRGLQLPPDFFPVTHEDFSGLRPPLFFMEPEDPSKIPKYPKRLVYEKDDEEVSIEEIKSRTYLNNIIKAAEQSFVLSEPPHDVSMKDCETTHFAPNFMHPSNESTQMVHLSAQNFTVANASLVGDVDYSRVRHVVATEQPYVEVSLLKPPEQPSINIFNDIWNSPNEHDLQTVKKNLPKFDIYVEPSISQSKVGDFTRMRNVSMNEPEEPSMYTDLWMSQNKSDTEVVHVKKNITKFDIYEESHIAYQPQSQPKGSAMKTPFKVLSDDDLAETGSRGGLDIATAAQPLHSANVINLDDETNSNPDADYCNLNATNTQMFNFNLNLMQVSTPESKHSNPEQNTNIDSNSTRKQLFGRETKLLSTILEETKSFASSASNGSSEARSALLNSKKSNTAVSSQEESSYHFNLAQNLKANAELRSSLLGGFMDCDSPQTSPIAEIPPMVPLPIAKPTVIVPLSQAPSDPFKASLIRELLERIDFPKQHTYGLTKIFAVPKLNAKKEYVNIGRERYFVEKLLGKGTFGSVYKAVDCQTQRPVALKMQKPPNKWEYYICRELQARLTNHPFKDRFMDVQKGYFCEQASILVSDYIPNGSLLDIANKIKQKSGRTMKENLCVFFCIEMLEIISAMHQTKIIHADIKPDNFLVVLEENAVKLHLIDFGCSIDMKMFPPGATFSRKVTTEDFVCCEMLDGRPWNYHTDLFCIAATAHVLLFDKYIQMTKKDGHWSITQRFNRYFRVDCWNMFFSNLLNQQNGPAKIEPLLTMLRGVLDMSVADLSSDMRFLVNLLKDR